jgi:hypothetical protein
VAGFTKLFSSITESSVWCEPHTTVRVWVAMLARADAEGIVEGSIPGFASLCRVTVAEMEEAVRVLSSADPYSRTPAHEGRRIESVPGGWVILNYGIYRQRAQDKEGSKAPAMRALRARRRVERAQVTGGNALPPGVTGDPEERGERREDRNGDGQTPAVAGLADVPVNGNGNGHRKDRGAGSATLRERDRLEADPVLAGLADAWAKAMDRSGREITVLRAARAALAGGYAAKQLVQVAQIVGVARREPERFPERGSIRWAVERGKTGATYLWRPEVLDRLIPEAEAWARE